MDIYEKIQACRASIKAMNLEKKGFNEYSKYYYYTPEQVDMMVHQVCIQNKIFHKFELKRNEFGIYGFMTIIDLESQQTATFEMASAIPSITATNDTQKLGGASTFTNRYLLQNVFDIVDNTLDPDSQDNRNKSVENKEIKNNTTMIKNDLPWLNEDNPDFDKIKNAIKTKVRTITDLRKIYKISNKIAEILNK
jgi:hypothetical protein